MTEQDVLGRLYELSESDVDGLRKLAEEISVQCREPAWTILTEWLSRPPARRHALYAFTCAHLKELAIAEMRRRVDFVAPAPRVHLMEMVVTQHLVFRELMLTALEPLLRDRTALGGDDEGGMAVAASDKLRTCDAAYLLVRRILRPRAAEAGNFSAENQFTALKRKQRDREIGLWVRSETWREIFPAPPH